MLAHEEPLGLWVIKDPTDLWVIGQSGVQVNAGVLLGQSADASKQLGGEGGGVSRESQSVPARKFQEVKLQNKNKKHLGCRCIGAKTS